jgi:FkbM family methyltransferase
VDEVDMHPAIASFDSLLALRDYSAQNPNDFLADFARFCSQNVNVSRSQLFQDMFVALALRGKPDGYFVEFGATNGLDLSNTFFLEKQLRWKGILAEPARTWHEALRKNRTAAIDTRCVWDKSGETLTFLETNIAELSTVSDFRDRDFNKDGRKDGKTYDVQTVSLNDLLSKHAAPNEIDYMSIDTEGSEFKILNSFDFQKYKIKIITVEHNYCDPDRQQIFDLLAANNFVRILEPFSKFDDWYVQKSLLGGAPNNNGP